MDTNFSSFVGFSLAGIPYVWAYRSSDGTVCIHQIDVGGTGFTQKFIYQWDTGFSGFTAVSDAAGNVYVWAYRSSDGTVCIHQINPGGRVHAKIHVSMGHGIFGFCRILARLDSIRMGVPL